jgi:hypothetical protein
VKKLITTAFLLIALANVSHGQDVETIEYSNGDVYVGNISNEYRSGFGQMYYATRCFESDFQDCE